jgi:hypothetical protein
MYGLSPPGQGQPGNITKVSLVPELLIAFGIRFCHIAESRPSVQSLPMATFCTKNNTPFGVFPVFWTPPVRRESLSISNLQFSSPKNSPFPAEKAALDEK